MRALRLALLPLLLLAFAGPVAAYPPGDDDGDGFQEPEDCDDRDARTYPGATERSDGVVDETTELYDDDGDGLAEYQGDCDDTDPTISADALEIADGLDNDCDGAVDEGTTGGDDDGDGYTEAQGDCDDADPTVHPGVAVDDRNGVDDDCDGLVDEEAAPADTGVTDTGHDTGTADTDTDRAEDTDEWAPEAGIEVKGSGCSTGGGAPALALALAGLASALGARRRIQRTASSTAGSRR